MLNKYRQEEGTNCMQQMQILRLVKTTWPFEKGTKQMSTVIFVCNYQVRTGADLDQIKYN